MLFKFFRRLFSRQKVAVPSSSDLDSNLEKAAALMVRGDNHGAIVAYQQHLKFDPYNVEVLNNLGVCQADIGNLTEASALFELAYSLDDTHISALTNRGKLLTDQKHSTEALEFLRQAKICEPRFAHADAVYAGVCLSMGNVAQAHHVRLRAWLASFDNLRLANCYLFDGTYDDIDESEMATEHRFWAETVYPLESKEVSGILPLNINNKESISGNKKIRIGYWSPDFRGHSVRYFFRPLLENHDPKKFETFLYHDFLGEDAQTELMRSACTHFHSVSGLSDQDLHAFISAHQLDVFVELAGHSSYNRVTLLQQRFATVQISALGYPPTTGLSTIDAKVLDRHLITPDNSRYYAESPLVLPTSFWCFDPMEAVPEASEPPIERNGFVTFGCFGNIAKINMRILHCWKAIFESIPTSRLVIRSINFEDAAAEDAIRLRLVAAGIAIDRVDLRKPAKGADFFGSYGEIDIVLDTFPFNGGTTTCFAAYMGVPVVTWAGASLVSRMGLSIMTNMAAPELVVTDAETYIERAVTLANDLGFLRSFRREARERFKDTSLGNGELFAREFEEACKNLLERKRSGDVFAYQHTIAPLPEDEAVRRAYTVLGHGQTEAAQRILDYCLRHYPDSGGAHLIVAQQLTGNNRFHDGIDYLLARLEKFSEADTIAALITIVRLYLLAGEHKQAAGIIDQLSKIKLNDEFDRLQVQLYHACLLAPELAEPVKLGFKAKRNFHILIPCDNIEHFDAMCSQIQGVCWCPDGWTVSYGRCDESQRVSAYQKALQAGDSDFLIIIQKNIEIYNSMFFIEVAQALRKCDLLGIAGATRWQRLDWRSDDFSNKAAGFLVRSSENPSLIEIQLQGGQTEFIIKNIAILDGCILALNPAQLQYMEFDEQLLGAEFLLEEDWTHAAFQAGHRLAVHRNLGAMVNQQLLFDRRSRAAGRMRVSEKYFFDPFSAEKDNFMLVSAPVASAQDAVQVVRVFLSLQNKTESEMSQSENIDAL